VEVDRPGHGAEEHLMSDEEFANYVSSNYNRFLGFVQGYVRPPLEAADVLQETLLALWSRRHDIDATAPGGYFFRSLYHAVVSSWRVRSRNPHSPLPEEGLPDPHPPAEVSDPPASAAHSDALTVAIARCIADVAAVEDACVAVFRDVRARMPPPQPAVFAAFLQSKGSQKEAMALLNLPSPSTYPNALHRARKRIRQVLAPHREALLRILGAVRVWELLLSVFCDGPEGLPNEEEK
jgi:DNA-directed RNA polymerase specialized sigma24 family protein